MTTLTSKTAGPMMPYEEKRAIRITQNITKRSSEWRIQTFLNGQLRRESFHRGTKDEAETTAIQDHRVVKQIGVEEWNARLARLEGERP